MRPHKRYCGIKSCENYNGTLNKERIFFRLPAKNPTERNAWLNAIRKHQTIHDLSDHTMICDLHFRPHQIIRGCRTKVTIGAVPTIFRTVDKPADSGFSEMRPIESKFLSELKSEPMDSNVDMQPSVSQFTYSIRNRLSETSIKIEIPDANEEYTVACIDNEIPQSLSQRCVRCSSLKMNKTKLKMEIDEIQEKYQIVRTENKHLKAKIVSCTNHALRLGQIKRYSRCELCLSLLFENQLRDHLCAGLTEIACEYCATAKFTSTRAITEHLSSGIHTNMRFQKCSQCSLGFRLNSFLKIHEQTHEQTNGTTTGIWYKCRICDESSDRPLELVRHFSTHSPIPIILPIEPSYECYICKCPLNRHSTVRRHLKQHVAARDTKCQICKELFTSNELTQWHICDTEMDCSRIQCEYCDESFQSIAKCMEHLKTAHADDKSMYQCRTCSRYFGMERLRDLHEKFFPHPTKSFQCHICSKQWAIKHSLVRHMKNVHSGNISVLCSECGKCYSNEKNLRLHMAIHKEPTIQCPDCPQKFRTNRVFQAHYEWHQNLKFRCNQCNRTFAKRITLQTHIREVHKGKTTKAKKQKCPYCDLELISERLQRHIRSHTGERPFQCEVCEKSYRYKGDLTKHMQTHVGDNLHKCDLCHQAFRYHADMKQHRFAHYKEAKEKQGAAAPEPSTSVEN